MNPAQRVSLYIPCYNVEKFIERCIEAVLAQSLQPDEILIIDDGCKDRTVELASRYPVRVVRHERNRGLAAGRNTGIANARNELVAALDADCIADPRWLEVLIGEVQTRPDAAMVGGRLVETMLGTPADRWRKAHMSQDWGGKRRVNPPFMYGNNNVVRKAMVTAAGGYDESYRTNGEDVYMSTRLMRSGHVCIYRPDAVVGHLREDTLASVLDTYWRYWKFGRDLHLARFNPPRMVFDIGYGQVVRSIRKVLVPDLVRGRWELLGIDAQLPFYMARRYLELVAESRKSAAPAAKP